MTQQRPPSKRQQMRLNTAFSKVNGASRWSRRRTLKLNVPHKVEGHQARRDEPHCSVLRALYVWRVQTRDEVAKVRWVTAFADSLTIDHPSPWQSPSKFRRQCNLLLFAKQQLAPVALLVMTRYTARQPLERGRALLRQVRVQRRPQLTNLLPQRCQLSLTVLARLPQSSFCCR